MKDQSYRSSQDLEVEQEAYAKLEAARARNLVSVTAAAICRGPRIWTGRRHNEIMLQMIKEGVVGPYPVSEQGFLLSDGSFASRRRAREVAVASGQLLSGRAVPRELTSEDLW